MRVLVTGASGFVGRWLTKELITAGHEAVETPSRVDVTDADAVREALDTTRPDAIAHLAAVAFAPDAAADPKVTFSVAVGGTINVLEAVRSMSRHVVVLITGSSEVYGSPAPDELPLRESNPIAPVTPYALSKAAQESVALAYAARYGLTVVVTRSFSHTGPGQRPLFVVPALAQRVHALATGQAADIRVGNVDVRRDFCDVRDVVDAYRRLLEAAVAEQVGARGLVVNVCSGQSVSIRWILEELCRLAGVKPSLRVDPTLVRPGDTPEVRGDPSLIEQLVAWQASTPLARTLADVWAAVGTPVAAASA